MIRWVKKPIPDNDKVMALQDSLGVSSLIATLLVQRGITDYDQAKTFFRPHVTHLHDPFLMKDMDLAVQRLSTAIAKSEKILIYGDYDVDGTTSVAQMYLFLKSHTEFLECYIPDRYSEGYGISNKGIDYAKQQGVQLIICLDCGIKAIDKVAYANQHGIDFIICDHHRPGNILPNAIAVLDPKRQDCSYPFKELSACGVGFKLIQAYCQNHSISFDEIKPLMDLVAVSIAADIVPIIGENRTLAYHGLKQINSNPRAGIKALLEVANKEKQITISDLVFGLAPRINAAGRIDHAIHAVELLIQEDFSRAKQQAERIDKFNFERRDLDQQTTKEALEMTNSHSKSTVVFSPHWHKGVVGIVASRLIESHYKPTIVLTESNGKLTGSARSVKGFDIYDAINECSDLLEQFGGHKYAAGLTLKKENLVPFAKQFEEVVRSTIKEEMLHEEILIDLEIELEHISAKTYRILQQMAPFGPSNSKPVFMLTGVRDSGVGRIIGQDESHLKLSLTNASKSSMVDAIGFGMAPHFSKVKNDQFFDVCFVIEENQWNGKKSIQLRLKDLKQSLSQNRSS